MSATAARTAARWPWLVGAVALLAAALPLQAGSLASRPARELPAVLYLQSPGVATRVALAFDGIVSDLYWMRALQHFGATRLRRGGGARRFEDLHPFLDLTTSLDPRFSAAFRFGAIFLSEPPPGGPGRPDLAARLLEKGIAATPDRWQYWQDLGFVHYWWTRDYEKASTAFSKGATVTGAPWWMQSLAAVTLAEGGDRRTSRFLWRALAQSADNPWLQRDAQRRLQQLDALDGIDALDAVVARASKAGGSAPWSWAALLAGGQLTSVPFNPTGAPYVINMTSGKVGLSPQSPLWPLPSEPRTLPSLAEPTR